MSAMPNQRLASCTWNCEAPSFNKFQRFINWLQKKLQP